MYGIWLKGWRWFSFWEGKGSLWGFLGLSFELVLSLGLHLVGKNGNLIQSGKGL